MMRVADVVMAALFLFSAAVQLNDPDPCAWLTIYSVAAVAAGCSAARGFPRRAATVLGWVAFAWGVGLGVQHFNELSYAREVTAMAMRNEATEVLREMGGLGIVAAWTWARRGWAGAKTAATQLLPPAQ